MSIEFTRKQYLEVWFDGVYISRHTSLVEAAESASDHGEEGIYEVRVGSEVWYEVSVKLLQAQSVGALSVKPATGGGTPSSDWPPYRKHAQGAINVAGQATNMETEPYRTWNSSKDLMFAQHRYPTTSQVNSEIASTAWMRGQNANIKLIYYSFNQVLSESTNQSSAKEIGTEACNVNGAFADWALYDSSTGGLLGYSNEADGNAANPYYDAPGMPTGSTDANFSIAYWRRLDNKYSSAFPWDGF